MTPARQPQHCPHKIIMTEGGDCNYTHSDCQYQILKWDGEMLQKLLCGVPCATRTSPPAGEPKTIGAKCTIEDCTCNKFVTCDECRAAFQDVRVRTQSFIDFAKFTELKNGEMIALMRRNGLKLDNLEDPMQKLAFTFYIEIAELSHKADVILEEYAESLRAQPEQPR